MEQKDYWSIGIIAILGVLVISGCIQQQIKPEEQTPTPITTTEPKFVTAKLISITGGDFVPSAGYYEGKLILSDITTGKEYPIFACSESWNWVKESSCYKLNPEEVNENVEQHKFSAELSGCYVGSLEEVSC